MTTSRHFVLTSATLIIAQFFMVPRVHAQWPPWEYINSPEMSSFARLAVNDGKSAFYACANSARIATLPCTFVGVKMDVPQRELPRLQIALDNTSRPWMISDRHFYRPALDQGSWVFTAEPRAVQADPLFLTITPWDAIFVSDPSGGALRSTDLGEHWQSIGPIGVGRALGVISLPDGALLLWTESILSSSIDRGDSWTEITLPEGCNSLRHVHADGHGIVVDILRHQLPFLARCDGAGGSWEDITPSRLQPGDIIREISGFNGAVLLLVERTGYPCAFHLPAGEREWRRIGGLPMDTRRYTYFGDGRVCVARPGHMEIARAPGELIKGWFGAGNVTDSNAMLCVDAQTFVIYRHDDGFYRSTDAGQSWYETLDFPTALSHELRFGHSHRSMYAFFYSKLFLSADAGASWKESTLPEPPRQSRVAETASGDLFLIEHLGDGIIRSTDFGTSWTEVRAHTGRYVLPPLQAVGNDLFLLLNDSLFTSSDFGTTWRYDAGFRFETLPSRVFILDRDLIFAMDDVNRRMLLSTDVGRTWTPAGGTRFLDMQRLPNSSTIYGYTSGCGSRLFVSPDNGRSWGAVYDDIAESVCSIRLSPQGHLVVATSGSYRSHFLWKNAAVLSAHSVAEPRQLETAVWPQPVPAGSTIQVEVRTTSGGDLSLQLYDLLGRCLGTWTTAILSPGQQRFTLPIRGMQSGVYFLHVQTPDGIATRKLLVGG